MFCILEVFVVKKASECLFDFVNAFLLLSSVFAGFAAQSNNYWLLLRLNGGDLFLHGFLDAQDY